MMREKCTKKRAKKRASGGGAHRTTWGENRTNGKEEKNREKGTKISTKFAYVRNFVYLCRRIWIRKKDESKMDRVGE